MINNNYYNKVERNYYAEKCEYHWKSTICNKNEAIEGGWNV